MVFERKRVDFKDIHGCAGIKRGMELAAVADLTPVFYGNKHLADRLISAYKKISMVPAVFVLMDYRTEVKLGKKPNLTQGDVPFLCVAADAMMIVSKPWEPSKSVLARVDAAKKIFGQTSYVIIHGSNEHRIMKAARDKIPELREWNVFRLARAAAALDGKLSVEYTHLAEALQYQNGA